MPNLRRAARVVALSPDNRVLLVRFELPTGTFWALPGGGVEGEETRIEAARRELLEETGIVDVELIGPIWERTHHFALHGFDGQHEQFFLARTTDEMIAPKFSAEELLDEGVTTMKWWSLEEIAASNERFAPRDLANHLIELKTNGAPQKPIVLPEEFPPPPAPSLRDA